jgi:hypothetical protein
MHLNDLPKERLPTALRTSKEPALHSIFFFSSLRMMPNRYFKGKIVKIYTQLKSGFLFATP